MPVKMFEFCQAKKLLEDNKDCKKYNVELKDGTNDYKGTNNNFVFITGSSKSVDNFYKELLRRMYENLNLKNDDGE